MEGKTPKTSPMGDKASAPARPKPVARTVTFPLSIENAQTGEVEHYRITSTIHRDMDGMIDRMSRALAQAPLSDFLPYQADRFIELARCFVQIDNFDPTKKLSEPDELVRLEGHLLDNVIVRKNIVGRLVEHHRRFRFGDGAQVSGEGGEGAGAAKVPVVVVGEFDAPPAHPGGSR